MKIRKSQSTSNDKVEIQMTPMIDIVFQLLVFFIMTFKIVAMEGDFNIKMPQASAGSPDPTAMIPMTLKLRSGLRGDLVSVTFDNQTFEGTNREKWAQLQAAIVERIGANDGPSSVQEESEIEIDADYNLKYVYVIEAITAVTGRVDRETGEVQKLIEKIKFAPGSGSP